MADVPRSLGWVSKCNSDRCKTCAHMVEGSSFGGNTNKRKYYVACPQNDNMDCGTRNVDIM